MNVSKGAIKHIGQHLSLDIPVHVLVYINKQKNVFKNERVCRD